MLGVGVADIVQVVCVIVSERKSVLHVLHVRYVLVIKTVQVVSMCYHMGVVTPAILYLPAQDQHCYKPHLLGELNIQIQCFVPSSFIINFC